MDNIVTNNNHQLKKNALHFEWVLPVFLKPRQTMQKIATQEKPVWLTPLLVVSVLIFIAVLVSAPIKRNAVLMAQSMPEYFDYYSSEQQAAFMNGQSSQTSPLFIYVLPFVSKVAGLWVSWFILSSVLHLSLTLTGSRATNVRSYNLAGWSFLPIALRHVIQIMAMLFSKNLITAPGLSGFIGADAVGFTAFIAALLGLIDIYFIWQIFLLVVGVIPLSGLERKKAWSATAVTLLVLVLFQCVPGFLSHVLSGFSMGSGFYF